MNPSYPRLLVIAGTTSTLLLGGCATPVAEQEIIGESVQTTCPDVYRTRTVRRLEPLGEHFEIRRTLWPTRTIGPRVYNPMLQSWERPWPYGPYRSD